MNKKYNLAEMIKRRLIVSFSDGPKLVKKEVKAAEDDLSDAEQSYSQGGYKWATVQGYYSIFHIFRALLYNRKYREKSHIQLGRAIKALYIDKAELPEEFYEIFTNALTLRELADYKSKFSKNGAQNVIGKAKIVLKTAKKMLNNK